MSNWFMKIAAGKIVKGADGTFIIGDQEYYINILSSQIPIIRDVKGETELILPIDGSNVKYEIIW